MIRTEVSKMVWGGKRFVSVFLVFVVVLGTVVVSGCTGGGSGEKNWLKLVPEDAVLAGVFDASTLDDLKDLMKEIPYEDGSVYDAYIDAKSEIEKELGMDPDDVSRVIFVITKFPKSDYEEPLFAIYAEGSIDTSRVEEKIKNATADTNVKVKEYGGAKIYYSADSGENFGVALGDGYIVLGSSVGLIEDIVDLKNGKGKWAERYEDVVDKVGSGNLILVYDIKYFLGSISRREFGDLNQAEARMLSFAGKMEYGAFKFKVAGEEYSVKTVLRAEDEATAKSVVKNANALITLANTTLGLGMAGAPEDFVKSLQDLLGKIRIEADGKYVVQEFTVNKKDIEDIMDSLKSYEGYMHTPRDESTSAKRTVEEISNILENELSEGMSG